MLDYFVTDYDKPKTWRWMQDARLPQQQSIRGPHGLSAARIKVPNGWFGQWYSAFPAEDDSPNMACAGPLVSRLKTGVESVFVGDTNQT